MNTTTALQPFKGKAIMLYHLGKNKNTKIILPYV